MNKNQQAKASVKFEINGSNKNGTACPQDGVDGSAIPPDQLMFYLQSHSIKIWQASHGFNLLRPA